MKKIYKKHRIELKNDQKDEKKKNLAVREYLYEQSKGKTAST